jgi:2-oxoisovalerate dehydrogenase E2 component (dihydrolipoyl transacylase)
MENNINLSDINGTGKEGRVLKEDILRFIDGGKAAESIPPPAAPVSTPAAPIKPAPQPQMPPRIVRQVITEGKDRVEPLKGMVKAMSKSMNEALKIPHFGY